MNKYYIDYLRGANKSENTIKSYVGNVQLMLKAINKLDTEITFLDMVAWQSGLHGLSTSTVHNKVIAAQDYFDFLVNAHIINENPAKGLNTPKVINAKKPDPEDGMVRSLINCARGKRDKAMITVFATTGMRFDEATSMLDPRGKKEIRNLINDLRKENKNMSFVSITHDINEAFNSDYIYVLDKGEVALEGTKEELVSNYKKLYEIGLSLPMFDEILIKLNNAGIDVKDINNIIELGEKLCR